MSFLMGLRPENVTGAMRFGVRQLAAAFPPRRDQLAGLTSIPVSRIIQPAREQARGATKRQQAAALQSPPFQQHSNTKGVGQAAELLAG